MKIKSRWIDRIIFEAGVRSLRLCVEAAARAGVSLRDANLHDADFRGADFHGADFRGADLTDANLHGADLNGIDVRYADLTEATDCGVVELLANASPIAASPDLLAACEKWLDHYDNFVRQKHLGDEPGIAEMRAAVAKARGEGDR